MKRTIVLRTVVALCLICTVATASAQQQGDRTVRIGVLTDMEGAYGDVSGKGSVVAAQMAIEDFGGNALGTPIKLVAADHQNKSDVAVAIAREWYGKDGIDMIMDLPNSGVALAVQHLAYEMNKISIISAASTDAATNKQCSPNGAHWTYDSYSAGKVVAKALGKPGSTWFFLTVDYAGGISLQNSLSQFLEPAGAKVIGSARYPLDTLDMSSFLLQAQASGAKYVALATAGTGLVTTMKQAREFGLTSQGQTMVGIVVFMSDLKAIGLEAADGLLFSTGFWSEASPEAAAWSKRFFKRHGAMPNDSQAGVYSATLHYLKSVEAANTTEASAVMAKMRELPVNDMFAKNGKLREDGRMVHDMYVVQAKKPSESSGPWDLVKLVQTIPGDEAFRSLAQSECPLVKDGK
jgi:branched-chain amino acid transport system substrate-binding protein